MELGELKQSQKLEVPLTYLTHVFVTNTDTRISMHNEVVLFQYSKYKCLTVYMNFIN